MPGDLLDQMADNHWHHLEVDHSYDARGLPISTVRLDGRVLEVKRITISGRMPPIGAANRVAPNLDTGGEGEHGGSTDENRRPFERSGSWDQWPWRPGRKVGRTVYAQGGRRASDDDVLIGVMDTEWYAEMVCRDHNAALGLGGEPGVFPNV